MVEQACISDALKTKCLERQRSKTFVPDPIPWGWSATEPKLAKRLSSCQKPMIPTASCKVSDKLSYRTWLVSFDSTAKWHLDSGVSLFWGFGCPWYHPNLQVSKCPKYPDQPKHYPNLSEKVCGRATKYTPSTEPSGPKTLRFGLTVKNEHCYRWSRYPWYQEMQHNATPGGIE